MRTKNNTKVKSSLEKPQPTQVYQTYKHAILIYENFSSWDFQKTMRTKCVYNLYDEYCLHKKNYMTSSMKLE